MVILLVIDVGNTNIVLGLFKGDKLVDSFRMTTKTERTKDEFGIDIISIFRASGISADEIKGCIISSVVPQIMYSLERAIIKYLRCTPIIINSKLMSFMQINYENKSEVGADRLVNAYAGFCLYKSPLIIIDFGTATTFCAVDQDGAYLGGVIAPGIKISSEALFTKTAKLPRIEIVKPQSVIGKNTVESMQSGIFYGYAGLVDNIVNKIKEENFSSGCKVIASGGLATLIAKESTTIDVVDSALTLHGLKLIHDRMGKETNRDGLL